MLAGWGRLVHRFRLAIIVLSLLSLAPSLWLIFHGGRLATTDIPTTTESGRALDLIGHELPGRPPSFSFIFSSPTRFARDEGFRQEVERAVAPLRRDARVARVLTAYDPPVYDASMPAAQLVSRDGRRALVVVELKGEAAAFSLLEFSVLPPDVYPSLRALVKTETLEVLPVGNIPLNHDFTEVTRTDLRRAELVILPVVVLLLLLVFGSVVAALLPLVVGALSMAGAIAATLLMARYTSVSVYAPNIVTMIGLGVAIDYSLFIVSRYRQEIRRHPGPEALERTMATAGRAILFSGLTVAIGLLGMVFLGLGNVGSIGWAGTVVVSLAVLYALTLLPALLAVLGPRVNALRLPFIHPERRVAGAGIWHRVAGTVMAHPWAVFVSVSVLLLFLGLPFLHLKVGSGDVTALPPEAVARRGDEALREHFPGADSNRILVVVRYPEGTPLTAERVGGLYDLSRWLAARPNVARVESLVDLDPSVTREQYQQLATAPAEMRPPGVTQMLRQTVGGRLALLVVSTAFKPSSAEARALVEEIRASHPRLEGEVLVTGQTAFDLDIIDLVRRHAPMTVGLVMVATYVVLFLLLGSVLLPLKAVIMNLLSISASYGALVWIFQDGHLARWLHFTPGPIQTATPLIMFCFVFGLSMDYEVLLLSRVKEEYERTGDTTYAVAEALASTGRLITGAAAIMAAVFFGFATARSVIIQAVGIGIGVAVVIDATIVRALLVPATMRLMGRWNWWAPAPLVSLHRRLGLAERSADAEVVPR
ncbi:MAG TPA: MMPL family transporter [Methylomirabilota bacterium]|nr:MMPL family transporter [Methylomirabilota bacterium]